MRNPDFKKCLWCGEPTRGARHIPTNTHWDFCLGCVPPAFALYKKIAAREAAEKAELDAQLARQAIYAGYMRRARGAVEHGCTTSAEVIARALAKHDGTCDNPTCDTQAQDKKALAIDHVHGQYNRGHLRGFLCMPCNTLLGKAERKLRDGGSLDGLANTKRGLGLIAYEKHFRKGHRFTKPTMPKPRLVAQK